jgi:hypothetical protein
MLNPVGGWTYSSAAAGAGAAKAADTNARTERVEKIISVRNVGIAVDEGCLRICLVHPICTKYPLACHFAPAPRTGPAHLCVRHRVMPF